MSHLRFNHVFVGLMLLAGVIAFAVPPRYTDLPRRRVDIVFAPVAAPLRQLAIAISGQIRSRADGAPGFDAGSGPAETRAEIDRLRTTIASLTVQNAELRQLNASRELAGEVSRYARPFKVIGGDGGGRQALTLAASTGDRVAVNQPVLHRDGLVGKVASVSSGGAQVRLVTDRGFCVAGAFGRFQRTADGRAVEFIRLATPPPLLEGRGDGTMGIINLTLEQLREAGVKEGDWVVLRDADWPVLVNGFLLGYVDRIQQRPRAPLFAEVIVRPRGQLLQLREVMVVMGAGF
jgi:cell shape-determining protein MreC